MTTHNDLIADALRRGGVTPEEEEGGAPRAVTYLRVSTSRQAHKNGEAEGYSLPAQREACGRKAAELGADVAAEFTDAGASARSADRPGLQQMLTYLTGGGIQYVIVHKIDRLARDRGDDVAILLALKKAGATLVSVTENIDDTPAGKLQHGIMATMAEYYSSNLSHEAKKGIAQKAKNGGTHGVAPLGYLNTLTRVEGRDVKSVALDPDRADHLRWAFQTYANGEVSISLLRDLLEERGLRSRKTLKYVGNPLSSAQLHRLLGNPYYIGKIRHRGVIYDGTHPPLVDDDTWYQVQHVLAGRRITGDQSWRHTHYLKGSLSCNRCGGRVGFGYSRGKGGQYAYFFCLGRHTGRTACDLPYIPADDLEREVRREWRHRVHFSKEDIEAVAEDIQLQLELHEQNDKALADGQRKRLTVLGRKKQRLVDAYLDGVLEEDDLRTRQAGILAEIEDARRLIGASEFSRELVRERIALLLRLMGRAVALYDDVPDEHKGWLNRAVFSDIRVDMLDHNGTQQNEGREVAAEGEVAPPVAALALAVEEALAGGSGPQSRAEGRTAALPAGKRQTKAPGGLTPTGGSNVTHLAATVREGWNDSARAQSAC